MAAQHGPRLKIDVHWDQQASLRAMGLDVQRGLTSQPKFLPPKYFYDAKGSLLFERITELPEYYLTRTERTLLTNSSQELIAEVRPQDIVELGSGSSSKTRLLLNSLTAMKHPVRYIPLDVSEPMVRSAASSLLQGFPFLTVHGVIGTFEEHLGAIPPPQGRRLVLFLGSTIGNLDRPERHTLLSGIRGLLGQDGFLLLGIDLVKDLAILHAAYNDSANVTAEFNRNVLSAINQALHADFAPEAYEHYAYYNPQAARIEMHLRPTYKQTVHVRDLELTVSLRPDETIWTESSYKFTRESITTELRDAGLRLQHWFTDRQSWFGLALAGAS
jgi:L-histidine N-alpha-methyltransferase